MIADNTIAVKPAAGPVTLKAELLKNPTTIPPITPETILKTKEHQKPKQYLNTRVKQLKKQQDQMQDPLLHWKK